MTGRTDFAQLRTHQIAARMGVRFHHNHRGAKDVNALEIQRMERELETLQTMIDDDPSRVGECGPAMRLLQERLTLAYIEWAKQSPFEHSRQHAAAKIRPHRLNYRPEPARGMVRPLLLTLGAAAIVTALALQYFGVLVP